MRVVVDPNVLISAAISRGTTYELVPGWFNLRSFEVIACPMLVEELTLVLARDKFRPWITEDDARTFVDRFREASFMLEDPATIPEATADPKDDYLVALARAAGADGVVSGDADLQELDESVAVWTPREFLNALLKNSDERRSSIEDRPDSR